MRITFLFILTTLISVSVVGQQFQKKLSIKLDPGTKPSQAFWADADNDSLLDIILTDTSQHQLSILAFESLIHGPVKKIILPVTGYQSGTLAPTDFNQDNKIDFVISGINSSGGGGTQVFINQGGFGFQKTATPLSGIAASKIVFADLNNDGQKEAVLIKDSGSLAVLKNSHQTFTLLFDSTHLMVQDFAVFDFDGNGFNDIAFSGKNQSGQVILTIMELENNLDTLRTIRLPVPISGRIETGDLNHDGFFDILVSGKNASGIWVTQAFMNNKTSFILGQTFRGLKNAEMKIADLDSDGKADLSFLGQDNLNDSLDWIKTFSGDSIPFSASHVIHQVYGDYDRDGDLDFLQVTDTLGLIIWENQEVSKNKGPSIPTNAIGVQLYTRFFTYWGKSGDDHTPVPALTYDLSISAGAQPVVSGEYDLHLLDRLLVTHGNQGTNNYDLAKIGPANYFFQVQSIDNSYTTANDAGGGSGVCHGTVQSCLNIKTQTIYVCDTSTVKLSAGNSNALWFSFSKGFLGMFDSLSIKPATTDTVFSFVPQINFTCNTIQLYNLSKSKGDTIRLSKKITGCLDSLVTLSVDREWQPVVWNNSALTTIATIDSFQYKLIKPEIITATGKNKHGCTLVQKDTLQVSLPQVTFNGEVFKIIKGQSVQLTASGGQSYHWTPDTGLDHDNIYNPIASPAITTDYIVTLTDSIGCRAQGTVIVEVTTAAFVPNLFTPNADGRNDELKIYGLSNPKGFRFTIFNREGAVVFETADWNTAGTNGWNGTHNGVAQPTGLYYWKVEGNLDQGGSLQLNGKTTGSILLVR